jgi:hypothetical protein
MAFTVYLDIGMNTPSQIYSDYAVDERRIGKRRLELLRGIVLEREEPIRMEHEPTENELTITSEMNCIRDNFYYTSSYEFAVDEIKYNMVFLILNKFRL